MKRRLFGISILFLTLPLWGQSAAEKLNAQLNMVQSIRAQYVQKTLDPRMHQTQETSGATVLRRPKMFRWQVEKPYRQLLVADGKKLYIYDEDLAQVTVQPLGNSIKDTPALILVGDAEQIDEHFTVTELSSDVLNTQYRLTPKDDSALVKAVVITFSGSAVTKLWLQDSLDQIIDITFSQVSLNDKLPAEIFQFKMPDDVDIIER